MGTVIWIIILILLLNTTAAIITVFKEKRDIAATWAWLLVLNLLPVVGFVIYLFAGKKISKEKIFDLRTQERTGISQLVALQKEQWNEKELMPSDLLTDEARQTVRALLVADDAILTKNNEVKVYTDGHEKFRALIEDVKKAKDHVHVEYYSFFSDQIGTELLHALEDACSRGVEVRIIYDSMGSRGQRRGFFKCLESLGGRAEVFFGSKAAPVHSPRLNYRLHRKIVVIDGKIGELSNLYSISLDVLLKGDEKMIEHLEESTDVVKSNQKMIGAIIVNIIVVVMLITLNMFIPDNRYFLVGIFCLMVITSSALLYQIIKKF